MAQRVKEVPQLSSEEDGSRREQDTEYLPEQRQPVQSVLFPMDSESKLRTLMDRIDMITLSLQNESQFSRTYTDKAKRRHGPENEDEKDLVSQNESLYTRKLTKQPSNILGGVMRDYQLEGLNWLVRMHNCGINGVLADEMGLGKTLQTIALLAQLRLSDQPTPHIIIVPKSTLSNWAREFRRWSPSLEVFVFFGSKEDRELIRPKILRHTTYHVLLTTYEIAMAEHTTLKNVGWSYLIIDEAHRIKNEQSVLSKVVRMFKSTHRLLITGTPLQNNLHELWSLLNFLMPNIFNSSEDFDEWFDLAQSDQQNQEYLITQLCKILRPFMLRRLKHDVETKLPAKNELYVFLGMTALQRQLYKDILSKNIEVINGLSDRSRLMNTIMQLRKTCNHPYLFENVEPGPPYIDGDHLVEASMKFLFLDKLIPRLLEKGSKLLIFTQMMRLLDILDDFLNFRGYRFYRIDGNTHYLQREEQIEAFQRPDSDVHIFVLSTRAGGLGINLQAANTVIIYDSDWNPQIDLQAMDRAHRIGQTRVVTVYRFVTLGTVEEKITERAAKKLKLDHLIIQKGSLTTQNKGPSEGEMNQIVQFGAQQVLKSNQDEVAESDIDKILKYAEQRTDELNQELAKLEEAYNLNSLKFDGSNFYEFEGDNYKKTTKQHPVSLGTRTRRSAGVFEAEMGNGTKKNKKKDWRFKVGGGHPHQFFEAEQLDALQRKEETWEEFLNKKPAGRRGKKQVRPDKYTDRDEKLKTQLLSQGFTNWSKKDFNNFIKGCELNGRYNCQEIAETIGTKSVEEVKEYAEVFWEKHHQLPNATDLIRRIEEGEREREKLAHIQNILREKQRRIQEESDTDSVDCSAVASRYSKEEDKFLLNSLFEEGYGNWDDIRCAIKQLPLFRFNFWFQSRSEKDVRERCDHIIEAVEEGPHKRARLTDGPSEHSKVEITEKLDWIITMPRPTLP